MSVPEDPCSGTAAVEMCLVVVRSASAEPRRLLLGEKLRGFGRGRVVVPGGKIDTGESPAEAAARELREETGLVATPTDLRPAGRLDFSFPHGATPDLRAHVFVVQDPAGTASNSDEIAVRWVPENRIPYDRMWADARHWLPPVLDDGSPRLRFRYGRDNTTVESVVDLTGDAPGH